MRIEHYQNHATAEQLPIPDGLEEFVMLHPRYRVTKVNDWVSKEDSFKLYWNQRSYKPNRVVKIFWEKHIARKWQLDVNTLISAGLLTDSDQTVGMKRLY